MKRVLLDENVDRRLKRFFSSDLEVSTVSGEGWSGLTNGKLLKEASLHFEVLVTMDNNLLHQQHIQSFSIGVVVIKARSNRRDVVEPMMDKINQAVLKVDAGAVVLVEQ
jgi:predicted nuclease of predicted toxin-antitoxin system